MFDLAKLEAVILFQTFRARFCLRQLRSYTTLQRIPVLFIKLTKVGTTEQVSWWWVLSFCSKKIFWNWLGSEGKMGRGGCPTTARLAFQGGLFQVLHKVDFNSCHLSRHGLWLCAWPLVLTQHLRVAGIEMRTSFAEIEHVFINM